MENPNKNKAYFLWEVFQIFFLENNLSLTHHISCKYYFFLYPLKPRETTILAPLSHSLTVSSQFSPFSLLFLSSHILTVSPPLVSSVFTDLSLFVSHSQELFLALIIFQSSLQKPQFYSLLSMSLTIYIVISCFY